jgi:hypothetical protein
MGFDGHDQSRDNPDAELDHETAFKPERSWVLAPVGDGFLVGSKSLVDPWWDLSELLLPFGDDTRLSPLEEEPARGAGFRCEDHHEGQLNQQSWRDYQGEEAHKERTE